MPEYSNLTIKYRVFIVRLDVNLEEQYMEGGGGGVFPNLSWIPMVPRTQTLLLVVKNMFTKPAPIQDM